MTKSRHVQASDYWTDERIKALENLLPLGLSAEAMARRLGGTTRNAVVGKIHRMGWRHRWGTSQQTQLRVIVNGQVRKPKAKRINSAFVGLKKKQPAKVEVKPTKPKSAVVFLADGWVPPDEDVLPDKLVPLADWPGEACKWPYGGRGSPILFGCTCERVAGLPYCRDHARRSYQPPEVRRPSQVRMPAEATESAAGGEKEIA